VALTGDVHSGAVLGTSRTAVSPIVSALVASTDWSATALGSPGCWPLELRSILDVVLASRFPMVFWWGPELTQFYNDAYLPIIGGKHPRALGQSASECWSEIWDVIGPQIDAVQRGGPATWNEDVLLEINRHGYVGEYYFTWSYSPLPYSGADNGVGGVLCTVQETTEKVIGERRILLLRDLAAYGAEATSAQDECRGAAETIARYSRSVPFALIYVLDAGHRAHLAAQTGIDAGNAQAMPPAIDLERDGPWPMREALITGGLVRVEDLESVLDAVPRGPWPEPPREAVVVPIQSGIAHELAGFLVAGVNAREPFDEKYGTLYELIAGQIAAAIASARAYENERKRAEALAELDRAKIEFFSNVSHEFRTPLTLMIGPLEELLRDAAGKDVPLIETAHRNSLRLLKLVNTLLEFARLEAGRNEALFVETDLAAMTQDLCGLFRSAIESAGLRFDVAIDAPTHAFVDRQMWEMIVLNLLSNALKFTHHGEIRVELREDGGATELSVSDTGIGIPDADLPLIFERFRRVRGAQSRSHEGTGIGLALVDDLVRLHGGSISVRSQAGSGSTFAVRIPLGLDHLDPERIAAGSRLPAHASVVAQYLADVDATLLQADAGLAPTERGGKASRILVADDNGDLRSYVTRILSPHHDVVPVRNGREALQALRDRRYDLVVSDVMMPELDGFELLEAVRRDPALQTIPFIMLSARAGEGAAIEGLNRGADDYLVKPFSADELIARVYAQLNAASARERATRELRANEERFRTLAASMPHIVLEAEAGRGVTFLSEAYAAYTGLPAASGCGTGWLGVVHPDDVAATIGQWERAMRAATGFSSEFRLRRSDGTYRWHLGRVLPQNVAGEAHPRWTGTIIDIHDMRRSAQERTFLSEASRILAQSLDLRATLQSLAAITVPHFADWCQIDLRDESGIRTVAVAHRDPKKHLLAQRFVGRVHLNPNAARGTPYAIRTGLTDIVDARDTAAEVVGDADELDVYRQMGLNSAVAIPLISEGETLGAIALVYGDSGRRYVDEDLPVLEELGRRAGTAVRHAGEFEREHRVAQSFQEASLPQALPSVPGVTFDAVYVPAGDEVQVGGDWYDAVRLADGRVVLSIGDVAGHGLHAAVTMGNIRQIIRGIAQVHADPALMLDAADRALHLEHPDQIVTAFVGVFDPVAGTFAYSSAGHPPAMLRDPEGNVELLTDNGLPLGLRRVAKERGKTVKVRPGSHLVLYTDGLTEASRAPADEEHRLRALLSEGGVLRAPFPARALRDAILGDASAADDVAILVLGVAPEGARSGRSADALERWVFDTADAQAAQSARRAFAQGLRARSADPDCLYRAEVVFGELVGNAARYAPGMIEVAADWSCLTPVLHVLDNGPGFHHVPALPRDVYSESGRGLFLISLLSEDFSVAKRAEGGSHARAVLALQPFPLSVRPRG